MVLTVTLHITWEANHARIANYNLPSTSPVWYSLCHSAVNSLTIVDSERLEYMHHSESCVCVVQIIDRKQHQCYPIAQHGIVRVKEPPHIRYTGPLTIKQYHGISWKGNSQICFPLQTMSRFSNFPNKFLLK